MRFEEMAQDLVQATSRLIGNRIINIMDTDGMIIASTQKQRVGTVHEGACEAIRTRRAVAIQKSDVSRYAGAREGYNIPVFSGRRILAVVGIFGDPDEVCDMTRLLAVYTAQCMEQNSFAIQRQISDELRTKYLQMLVALSTSGNEMLVSLSDALRISHQFPARVLVVRLTSTENALQEFQVFNQIVEVLRYQQMLNAENDVWGVIDNRLVILKSALPKSDPKFCARLHQAVRDCTTIPFQLCAGGFCSALKEVERTYQEALSLCDEAVVGLSDITDANCKFQALMRVTCAREQHLIAEMHQTLLTAFGEKELGVLLLSASCYYNEGGSVNKAADILQIHKNTLQYRLHRLWDALALGECGAFIKEYFLRLCIRYHQTVSKS